jgi:hypothetical protein
VSTRDGEPADLQRQIDDLAADVATNRAGIGRLQHQADEAEARADAAEERADAMEAKSLVDREMIAELQSEGVLSQEHAEQMDEALRSSRTIGAAIGLVMANRGVGQDEAFLILKRASQNNNRKVRDLAAELVATGSTRSVE